MTSPGVQCGGDTQHKLFFLSEKRHFKSPFSVGRESCILQLHALGAITEMTNAQVIDRCMLAYGGYEGEGPCSTGAPEEGSIHRCPPALAPVFQGSHPMWSVRRGSYMFLPRVQRDTIDGHLDSTHKLSQPCQPPVVLSPTALGIGKDVSALLWNCHGMMAGDVKFP
jgi:hypothetical protein